MLGLFIRTSMKKKNLMRQRNLLALPLDQIAAKLDLGQPRTSTGAIRHHILYDKYTDIQQLSFSSPSSSSSCSLKHMVYFPATHF